MGLPDHLKLCNTRHGVMLANVHDLYISRSLLIYGEFSEQEVELLAPFIKPDALVLDIGANIGTHTLAFARMAPQGIVFAFEPQRLVYQTLCANVALNGLGNVMAYQQGIGATPGQIRVPTLDLGSDGNFGAFSILGHAEGEPVSVVTIDTLNLPRVDLMKIDVEGMELEALQGARATITKYQPLLYVENDRLEKSPALIAALQDMGYDLWWHVVPYYRPDNFNKQAENIFGNVIGINMFCAPKALSLSLTAPNTQKVIGPDDHPMKQVKLKQSMQMA